MKRGIPQEHEELILGYEELEGAERARADALLREHPELAERLARHRRLESGAAAIRPTGRGLFDPDELSQEEIARQQESLRRVLLRATASAAGIRPAARSRWKRPLQWALPLAAALAFALLWPQLHTDRDKLYGVHILTGPTSGEVRGGELEPNTLHTGQVFAVEFELAQDAYVVIYHLDPAGRFAQAHPDPTVAAAVALGAGKHQVPSADAASMWVLDGQPGLETFFVAIAEQEPVQRFSLAIDPATTGRSSWRTEIEAQLRTHFDQVVVREFVHAD